MLEYGARVNVLDARGRSPLESACYYGLKSSTFKPSSPSYMVDLVKLLMAYGADVNMVGLEYTALAGATLNNDVEAIKFLVHEGADINAIYSTPAPNQTPPLFQLACRCGTLEVIQLLQTYGADKNVDKHECLLTACKYGNIVLVEWLLDHGVSMEAMVKRGHKQWSPLRMACEEGRVEVAQLLLQRGAEIDAALLLGLCKSGSHDVLKLLVKHGADVHAMDDRGRTLLHIASQHARPDVVKVLIASGADVSKVDEDDSTALDLALTQAGLCYDKVPTAYTHVSVVDHADVVRQLLACRAPGSDTKKLSTALYDACLYSSIDLIHLLIQYGATVAEAEEGRRQTCLLRAVTANTSRCLEIVRTLISYGAKKTSSIYTLLTPI